jgi:polyisoprenoid-binding protein YceI
MAIAGKQTSELPLPQGIWIVNAQRSEISFTIKSLWGLQTVHGKFCSYEGQLKVSGNQVDGQLTIQATSVDTRQPKRDRHLRTSDFFDTARHPSIVFTASAVSVHTGAVAVGGELKIRTGHLPLRIPVSVEQGPDEALRLAGEATVPREAFGITWNTLGMLRGDVRTNFDLILERVNG